MSKESTATKITKNYTVFNLDTMAVESLPISKDFTPATSTAEAIERLGSDEAVILDALNAALTDKILSDARKEAFGGNKVPKSAVLKHVNVYRNSPQFSKLVTEERGKPNWKEQYSAQTAAILKAVKDVPFIMDAIRDEKVTDEESEE